MNGTASSDLDIIDIVHLLKKRYKLIAIIMLSAITISIIISHAMHPVYRTSFVIRVPMHYMNEGWPLLNRSEFFRQKRIPEIIALRADVVPNSRNFIEITVDTGKPSSINAIKSQVLENFNHEQKLIDSSLQKEKVISLRNEVKVILNKIDSMNSGSGNFVENRSTSLDQMKLQVESIFLKEKLFVLEKMIHELGSVDIVSEPMVPLKPVRPRLLLNIILAAVSSFFFAIFIAIYLEYVGLKKIR